MRSISDLIVESKPAQTSGAIVLPVFILFVLAVMAVPLSMVWMASGH